MAPDSAEAMEAYLHARWAYLRQPLGLPRGSEQDPTDPDALHLMWQEPDGTVLGVVRGHMKESETAQVRYMGVHPDTQGRGIGRALLLQMEQRLASLGARRVILNARQPAVPFYQRCGYAIYAPSDTVLEGIPHSWMEKHL